MKKALSEQAKFNIRIRLYPLIKLMLEGQYTEKSSPIDGSTRLVFRFKEKVIEGISEEIIDFANKSNESISLVKDYLLELIARTESEKPIFKQEYDELRDIIALDDKQVGRE